MLMLQAEKMGYDIPVWGTFDRITNLNYVKDKNGNVFQARDKHGNKLPMVTVNKGEKSFPVFLTTFTVVNPETKEKIPYDDYSCFNLNSFPLKVLSFGYKTDVI